jgi:hypothetical protein
VSLVVLLILAVVWGVFLVPQVLRARADRGPADSIGAFRNQLSVLDKTAGSAGVPSLAARRAMHQSHSISAPLAAYGVGYRKPTAFELQQRRQRVFLGLLGLVIVTLALGLLFTPFFVLNIAADTAFGAYVVLLARARALATERDMKVRYLRPGPTAAPVPVPAYAQQQPQLRRSAAN